MDITEARKKAKTMKASKDKKEKQASQGATARKEEKSTPVKAAERVKEATKSPAEAPPPQESQKKSAIRSPQSETLRVVVFKLADHEHVVDVRRVKEILRLPHVAPVIEAPDFVEGVIKLRGRIVPIVDLRKRLHLPVGAKTLDTCVLIVRLAKRMVGFVVDSASELLTVPTRLIEPPGEIIGGIRTRFLEGVAYLDDRFLVFLKLQKILTLDEKEMLDLTRFERNEGSNAEAPL